MPRLRPLLTAAVAVASALAVALPANGAVTYTATTVTYKPSMVGFASPEIANPGRGQYAWMGYDTQVPGWSTRDVYYRDQVYFGRLAPKPGEYDFTWIESGLAEAQRRGGRFGFRVMTYCPGCWMHSRPDFPKVYPDYMPRQAGTTDVPAWNDESFLRHWEGLMAALGAKYGDDPRLQYVDAGAYGKWGEWHVDSGTPQISDASAKRVINAVLKAFPTKHVIVNAMNPRLTDLALRLSPRVGLRTDCLGAPNMYSLLPTYAPSSAARQRWRTAPILSEWCGANVSFTRGRDDVRTYHVSNSSSGNFNPQYAGMTSAQRSAYVAATKYAGYRYRLAGLTMPRSIRSGQWFRVSQTWANMGSAPTYDRWQVALLLFDSSGRKVGGTVTRTDLRTLMPGSRTGRTSLRFTGVRPGTYQLRIQVRDAAGYLKPMALSQAGRRADGSYALGSVRVVG